MKGYFKLGLGFGLDRSEYKTQTERKHKCNYQLSQERWKLLLEV